MYEQVEDQARLKKRGERFGTTSVTATTPAASSVTSPVASVPGIASAAAKVLLSYESFLNCFFAWIGTTISATVDKLVLFKAMTNLFNQSVANRHISDDG